MKRIIFVIIFILFSNFLRADIAGDIKEIKDKMVTKDEFKLYIEATDKRFDMLMWFMGLGFTLGLGGLASYIFYVERTLRREMNIRFEEVNKRFEEVNKRFELVDKSLEEVMSLILLLVKVHEKELGSDIIDVVLGKKSPYVIAKEMQKDLEERIKAIEKERLKEIIVDKEIINILINEFTKAGLRVQQ